MIIQYLKHGYRVTEVRSHEYCRKWGASKLPTYRKAYLFFWRLFLDLNFPKVVNSGRILRTGTGGKKYD